METVGEAKLFKAETTEIGKPEESNSFKESGHVGKGFPKGYCTNLCLLCL